MGHLAGKLSTVLYGMLRTMTVYDEAKHRREMSLPPVVNDNQSAEPALAIGWTWTTTSIYLTSSITTGTLLTIRSETLLPSLT